MMTGTVDIEKSNVTVGFVPEEVQPNLPTRSARLKWVIVVDEQLEIGRMVNAAACVAASVGQAVPGLLGPTGPDGSNVVHAGLPWIGCTVLKADSGTIHDLQRKLAGQEGFFIADMPLPAQESRIYQDYLAEVARTSADDLTLLAVSIVGPRNRVDKLVRKLPLL
jgi:hypothetical protein